MQLPTLQLVILIQVAVALQCTGCRSAPTVTQAPSPSPSISFGDLSCVFSSLPDELQRELVHVDADTLGAQRAWNPAWIMLLAQLFADTANQSGLDAARDVVESALNGVHQPPGSADHIWIALTRLVPTRLDLALKLAGPEITICSYGDSWREYWLCTPVWVVRGVPFQIELERSAKSPVPRRRSGGSTATPTVNPLTAWDGDPFCLLQHARGFGREELLESADYAVQLLREDRFLADYLAPELLISSIRAQAIAGAMAIWCVEVARTGVSIDGASVLDCYLDLQRRRDSDWEAVRRLCINGSFESTDTAFQD
jgi:hypothetical protein